MIVFIYICKKILGWIEDFFLKRILKFIAEVAFLYVLMRLAGNKWKIKMMNFILWLNDLKLIRLSESQEFNIRVTNVFIMILDKFKEIPTQVSQPLLLYPANHSKVYR